jgi:hypothetical protein
MTMTNNQAADTKKAEKEFYQPCKMPTLVNVPAFSFFSVEGKGNPNDPFFGNYVQVLYVLSYAVKMSPRQGNPPEGYSGYTVYPLEGVWDLTEAGKHNFSGILDKNELVFSLMIRQPGFVTADYASMVIEQTKKKKPLPLLDKVKFETIEEGLCLQIMHTGPFDTEPESFRKMEEFSHENGFTRISHSHREIYLSDPRRTAPEKLRTVLRFRVR